MYRKVHTVFGSSLAVLVSTCCLGCRSVECIFFYFLGGALGGWLPDLDLRHGHRTLMHNILAMAVFSTAIYLLARWVFSPTTAYYLAAGLALGYFSHIFLDSFTVAGVSLFYPLTRKRYRLASIESKSALANTVTSLLALIMLLVGLACSSEILVLYP